jgi:transposase
VPGERGYDSAKRVKGRKRHLLVDTLGLLLVVVVTAASVSENAGARLVLSRLGGSGKKLRRVWVDGGYRGTLLDWAWEHCRLILERVLRPNRQQGFVVQAHRWMVERTFAWITRCRRLSMDYEVLPASSEACIYLAMTRLMIWSCPSRCTNCRFGTRSIWVMTKRYVYGTVLMLICAQTSKHLYSHRWRGFPPLQSEAGPEGESNIVLLTPHWYEHSGSALEYVVSILTLSCYPPQQGCNVAC